MAMVLLLLLMLGVPGPNLASASDYRSEYDWRPTWVDARPSEQVQDELAGAEPSGEKLHVVYGVTATQAEPPHHNDDDDSAQQQQKIEQQQQQQQAEQQLLQAEQQQQQKSEQQYQHEQQQTHEYQQYHSEQSPNSLYEGQEHLDNYQDTSHHNSYNENAYHSTHYATNLVEAETPRPQRHPSKQQLSDKTWNVPAPYIKPNENLIEDVSFNIGLILVMFIGFVVSLGAIAGALTTKLSGGRAIGGLDYDLVAEAVLQGIQKLQSQFGVNTH
jgi:hypothetical protein